MSGVKITFVATLMLGQGCVTRGNGFGSSGAGPGASTATSQAAANSQTSSSRAWESSLASGGGSSYCVAACGTSCGAPLVCGNNGAQYCNACFASCAGDSVVPCVPDAGPTLPVDAGVAQCLQACAPGCPVGELRLCTVWGSYCASCAAACPGTVITACPDAGAVDASTLDSSIPDAGVAECLLTCTQPCPLPHSWVCTQEGVRFCDGCHAACHGATVVPCVPDAGLP